MKSQRKKSPKLALKTQSETQSKNKQKDDRGNSYNDQENNLFK